MGQPGRKPRTKPVFQTSVYLSEDAINALNGIRYKLPLCREVRITTQSDALELSAIEFNRILDNECLKVKSAAGRPLM